jgi:hypothetical protein
MPRSTSVATGNPRNSGRQHNSPPSGVGLQWLAEEFIAVMLNNHTWCNIGARVRLQVIHPQQVLIQGALEGAPARLVTQRF